MAGAFMTDSDQLGSLDGQQYIVVPPAAEVADFYDKVQSSARLSLPSVVTFSNTGHVTLRGFSEPRRVRELKQSVHEWALRQRPIDLRVAAIDGFPPPFKVVVARLARTATLIDSYSALTDHLDATDFRRVGELSLEDWIFHLSVAYCARIDDSEWDGVIDTYERDVHDHPEETVTAIEFVWYEHGVENSESIPLTG